MGAILNRPEFIGDIGYVATSTKQLPTNGGNLPTDRYLYGLRCVLEGRMVNPGAGHNPSAVRFDGIAGLINRITVRGNHKARNVQETIFDMRGRDAVELDRVFNGVAPYSEGTVAVTADASLDFRQSFDIIFPPMGVSKGQQMMYLLDAPNYEALRLDLTFGDPANVFTLGDQSPTLTAYGSAAGTPRVRVTGLFAQAGASRFAGFVPARCIRTFVENTSSDLTNTANGVRLFSPNKSFKYRALILKVGVKASVTAGMDAYLTTSDAALANIQVNNGLGRFIRRYPDFIAPKLDMQKSYGLAPSAGYCFIDFCAHGTLDDAFNTKGMVASGEDFYVSADVTGAASQAAVLITEELRYDPKVPQRSVSRPSVPVRRR